MGLGFVSLWDHNGAGDHVWMLDYKLYWQGNNHWVLFLCCSSPLPSAVALSSLLVVSAYHHSNPCHFNLIPWVKWVGLIEHKRTRWSSSFTGFAVGWCWWGWCGYWHISCHGNGHHNFGWRQWGPHVCWSLCLGWHEMSHVYSPLLTSFVGPLPGSLGRRILFSKFKWILAKGAALVTFFLLKCLDLLSEGWTWFHLPAPRAACCWFYGMILPKCVNPLYLSKLSLILTVSLVRVPLRKLKMKSQVGFKSQAVV